MDKEESDHETNRSNYEPNPYYRQQIRNEQPARRGTRQRKPVDRLNY
jgi:hypothetical protein